MGVLSFKGRISTPPEPPKPKEFQPDYPGKKLTEREYFKSLVKSFEPVVYGIVPDPISAQRRLDYFWPETTKAAKKYGFDPYILRGILYLEGRGEKDLVSGASCAGIAQFYPPTARGFGLKVSRSWRTFYNAYENERNPARKAKKWAKLQKYDERFNPQKAIYAAAHYLAYLRDKYEGIDYAIAAYHMGEPNLDKALRAYRLGWKAPEHFSWFELIMDVAPNRHPNTFAFLHDRLEDESWTYYFRVMASKDACWLWRNDKDRLGHTTYLIKTMFYDEMGRRGRRPRLAQEFWWYEDKVESVPTLVKLTEKHTNIIVDQGVSHPELTPEMAGMLYYMATDIRARGGGTIRVTSAYRTLREQKELVKQGKSPSVFTSHRSATGMDMAIPLSKKTDDLLEWGLMALRAKGDIVWYRERSHYHVTIAPKAKYFSRIPSELNDFLEKSKAHDEWFAKYGKLQPIGFWAGFWGRLFSWPWLIVIVIGLYLSQRLEKRHRYGY